MYKLTYHVYTSGITYEKKRMYKTFETEDDMVKFMKKNNINRNFNLEKMKKGEINNAQDKSN